MAKVRGGELEYTATIDTDQLDKAVDQTEAKINKLTKSISDGGDSMDDMFKITTENIRIQKDVIVDLEAQLKEIKKDIEDAAPGRFQAGLMQDAKELTAEIEAEKKALNELEQQVESTEVKHKTLTSRLREVKEAMAQLESAGKGNSDEFQALEEEAERLGESIQSVNAKVRVLSGQQGLEGTLSLLGGVAGAMSTAQGAYALFAGENENLQKIMLKVQSLMAITIGLQQVSDTLNKESAFNILLLTKAKRTWALTEARVATALGITNVAAKALMATLTLGLTAVISGIIYLWSKYTEKQAEANETMRQFATITADTAAQSITQFKNLQRQWNDLGDDLKAKKEFVIENKEAFEGLGVEVDNVTKAENILVNNSDAFVQVLLLRSKAMASAQLATEAYKESLALDLEAQNEFNKPKAFYSEIVDGWNEFLFGMDEVAQKQEKALDKQAEFQKFTKMQAELQEEIQAIMNASNFKEASGDGKTDGDKTGAGTNNQKEDPFIKMLNERKQAYQDFNNWLNSTDPIIQERAKEEFKELTKQGANYLEFLENLREKLIKSGSDAQVRQINNEISKIQSNTVLKEFENSLEIQLNKASDLIEKMKIIQSFQNSLENDNTEIDNSKKEILIAEQKDIYLEAKKHTDQLIEDYAGYLDNKIELEEAYNEDMMLLTSRLLEAKTELEIEQIKKAMEERKKQFLSDSENTGDPIYNELKNRYKDIEDKIKEVREQYTEAINKALEYGDEELAERITNDMNDKISELTFEELKLNENWEAAFGDLEDLTGRELDKLLNIFINWRDKMKNTLTLEELDVLDRKIKELEKKLKTKNPFLGLINSYKELKKAMKDGNKDDMFEGLGNIGETLKSSSQLLDQMGSDAISIFEDITGESGEMASQVLGDITNIASGVGEVFEGIASKNPAAIISGVSKVVKTFSDVISGDRKRQREIEKHEQAINALSKAYAQLSYEVNKALGTDIYDKQREQVANLQEQYIRLTKIRRAEQKKKRTDRNKVLNVEGQMQQIKNQISDIYDNIAEDITQTSAKSLADDLGNAIVTAWQRGEDASKSYEEVANNVMRNAVKNALQLKLLEEPMQRIVDEFMQSMGYDSEGNGKFDGLTSYEMNKFRDQIKGRAEAFRQAVEAMGADFWGVEGLDETGANIEGLSGAIKGITEDTAGLIEGQMNAIRINQAESLSIQKENKNFYNQIVNSLNLIATNTAHLTFMRSDINDLRNEFTTANRDIKK